MESDSPRTIAIVNRSGRRAPRSVITKGLNEVFNQHRAREGEVSVLLTEDSEMQQLNRDFRSVDESTDVLTFPSENPMLLGDIAISVPYAERQAQVRKVSLSQEIGFLAIHGGLHLLGFDDESEDDKRVMIEHMNRAAVAAGLKADHEWASLLHEGNE